MQRRDVLQALIAGGALVGVGTPISAATSLGQPSATPAAGAEPNAETMRQGSLTIERAVPGKPHQGKVLAAIQPHCDDLPLFAGGTVAKLIGEGYTGILIRTTNDEKAGRGATTAEVILNNERDNAEVARVLGLAQVFNLNYRNHRMDNESRQEMRGRMIHLFRLFKVDTVVCYDPWGHYEENPDHYVTASVVESACWMAGSDKDYVEQLQAGLLPHGVREKYYFARGPQLINRIVDITATIDRKVESNVVNVTQGPAGATGAALRARLAKEGKRLPVLGDNDETANRQYIKQFVLDLASWSLRGVPSDKDVGRPYGFEYAEAFHYIGPRSNQLEEYIARNAVPL